MYASLTRADILIKDDDGRRIAIQTDHREAQEIEDDFDLSVIFGLTRTLKPLGSDQFDVVRFTFMQPVNERFASILQHAGAEIETLETGEPVIRPALDLDEQATDAVAAACLERIGLDTLKRYGVQPTEQGLTALQTQFYAQIAGQGPEEDEIAWWTAVIELAAATGEVLRALHGGDWRRDDQDLSPIPFVLGRDNSLTNVFNKVQRFFARGESEAPTVLLRIMEDEHAESGRVMFNLRPPDWGAADFAWCRPLLKKGPEDMPLVALVHDLPNTTRSIGKTTDAQEIVVLEVQARANIAELEVEVHSNDFEGVELLTTAGDYYASEKLLDADYLRGLQQRLGADLLLASVPRKGVLFTMSALASPEASGMMLALAQGQHDDAAPNERLSPRVFLVQDGEVVGSVQVGDDEPEDTIPQAAVDESDPNPPKQGFWARLFGG